MNKVYAIITNQIMEQLEKGTIPWKRPWSGGGIPKNLVSKKEYRGINILLLGSQGYTNPFWVSFKQCDKLGGKITKGKKSTLCIFWKVNKYAKKNEETGEEEVRNGFILRYYRVFNVEQTEGIDETKIPLLELAEREFNQITECETVVENMPNSPAITNGVARAYYQPGTDSINMPTKNSFVGDEEYYSTLFHELAHSTGHKSRLNRHQIADCQFQNRTEHSKEELVAEMGAAFLCGHTGISPKTIDNSSAYIKGWLKVLKNDVTMVVSAGSKAQKAADYILDVKWD